MKSMTLTLDDGTMQVIDTLSDLANVSKTSWVTAACLDYAPLSVLRRRDPILYHELMSAAYRMAQAASWTPCKLASAEQDAVFRTEINNEEMMRYYRKQTTEILDRVGAAEVSFARPEGD